MSFGQKLVILREEKNMDRDELAKILNISYSAVSKYETDIRFPDQEILKKIADFFQVSTDYLLGRTDIRNPYDKDGSIKNDYLFETKSYLDKYGLPEEAVKQIDDYIEFIKQKYTQGGSQRKKDSKK